MSGRIFYALLTAILLVLGSLVRTPAGGFVSHRERTRGEAASTLCMLLIFLIMVIPESLRVNVGNDYAKYVEFMHLANCHAYVPTEPGFNWFVRLIYGLCGYENYLLVFALFAALTALFFLLALRQQADHFLFSFFIFLTSGYYLQSYNTVRYYLALAVSLFALKFLLDREWLPFVFWILLAASFHKSVLVVLILYTLCLLSWKKWQVAAACAAGILAALTSSFWLKVLVLLYPSYEGTDFLGKIRFSYVNILRCAAVLLLAYAAGRTGEVGKAFLRERRNLFYIRCTLLALGIYVFGAFVPEVSRIAYYLMITQVFLIPAALRSFPEGKKQKRAMRLVIAAFVIYFAVFLVRAGEQNIKILPYQTILFHDMPRTLSEVTN